MERRHDESGIRRRRKFHDRYGDLSDIADGAESDASYENITFDEGEESWKNAEGERLQDFGVDEEVEFYDEDDVPLGDLMRRRKQQQQL
jgi:palmitoyltransferase